VSAQAEFPHIQAIHPTQALAKKGASPLPHYHGSAAHAHSATEARSLNCKANDPQSQWRERREPNNLSWWRATARLEPIEPAQRPLPPGVASLVAGDSCRTKPRPIKSPLLRVLLWKQLFSAIGPGRLD